MELFSLNLCVGGATSKRNANLRECACVPSQAGDPRRLRSRSGRQDVRRAQALSAEACRKPKWRLGVLQAAVGALSVSERVFCKGLWRTPSSPPWPGIGMFAAITTMKVSGGPMPGCPFLRSSWDPSLLASTWICEFWLVVPAWNSEGTQLEKIIGHLRARQWHCFMS